MLSHLEKSGQLRPPSTEGPLPSKHEKWQLQNLQKNVESFLAAEEERDAWEDDENAITLQRQRIALPMVKPPSPHETARNEEDRLEADLLYLSGMTAEEYGTYREGWKSRLKQFFTGRSRYDKELDRAFFAYQEAKKKREAIASYFPPDQERIEKDFFQRGDMMTETAQERGTSKKTRRDVASTIRAKTKITNKTYPPTPQDKPTAPRPRPVKNEELTQQEPPAGFEPHEEAWFAQKEKVEAEMRADAELTAQVNQMGEAERAAKKSRRRASSDQVRATDGL